MEEKQNIDEKNNSEEIIFKNLMEKESNERFNKQWSKLDKGTKLNRLQLFIKMEKSNKSLTDLQENQLRSLLVSKLEMGELNKKSTITYDIDSKNITEIKNLKFSEETNKYYFETVEKKTGKKSKSKSNIDRHFSK